MVFFEKSFRVPKIVQMMATLSESFLHFRMRYDMNTQFVEQV